MNVAGVERINREPVISREAPKKQQAEGEKLKSPRTGISKGQETVGEKELIAVIEKANKALVGPEIMFKFSIHEGTKEIMVRVINEDTGEVIREIPPEKILDMVAKMWELAGIFVDERR